MHVVFMLPFSLTIIPVMHLSRSLRWERFVPYLGLRQWCSLALWSSEPPEPTPCCSAKDLGKCDGPLEFPQGSDNRLEPLYPSGWSWPCNPVHWWKPVGSLEHTIGRTEPTPWNSVHSQLARGWRARWRWAPTPPTALLTRLVAPSRKKLAAG